MDVFLVDPRYAEAFFHLDDPKRSGWSLHKVLGKPLRCFSIWHKFQLEFGNSPFLIGTTPTVADVEFAVAVCRTAFPQRVIPRVRQGFALNLYALWAERVNLPEEVRRFAEYLEDYYSPAKLWKKNGRGGKRDVDDSLCEVSLYRSKTGCSREEPWNLSIGELYWMNLQFARFEKADFDVWTPLDEARFQKHVKRRDQMLKERAIMLASQEGISFEEAHKCVQKAYWTKVRKVIAAGGASVDVETTGKKGKPKGP